MIALLGLISLLYIEQYDVLLDLLVAPLIEANHQIAIVLDNRLHAGA